MALGTRPRSAAPTGPTTNPAKLNRPGGTGNRGQQCIPVSGLNPPCQFRGLQPAPQATDVITLSISTPYMAGNLRPSFTAIYDWSGSYLLQPGIDWTFWDPFRVSIRYNYIEGRYYGVGLSKTKDNAWIELQYLLY
jgi:hypothetical protein